MGADIKFKITNTNATQIAIVSFSTQHLVESIVDHTPTKEILKLIKERLLYNASKPYHDKGQKSFQEKELKDFLNSIKD